jgi:hypothetical protein
MIYARILPVLAAGIVTVAVAGCQDNGSDLNRTGANSTYNSNYSARPSYNDRNAAYNGNGMNSYNSENTAGGAGSGAGQTGSR